MGASGSIKGLEEGDWRMYSCLSSWVSKMQSCPTPGRAAPGPCKQTKFFSCLQFSTPAAKISKCLEAPTHSRCVSYLPALPFSSPGQGPRS
jgi:hypothetical protein